MEPIKPGTPEDSDSFWGDSGVRAWSVGLIFWVHIYCQYGVRSHKSILIMAVGPYFHESRVDMDPVDFIQVVLSYRDLGLS